MFSTQIKLSAITLVLLSYCEYSLANMENNDVAVLEEIIVTTTDPQNKIGETTKNAKKLKRQQVQDSRDLVRYETGVSVVESGRFGASGYSIRGVDENRVAITIDGLHQAETLSSQGFKELFEGYGNFNNTRHSTEIENLAQAKIAKGADSVKAGSGALGGAVMFETKDARDLLVEKDYYASYKKGYTSADNQSLDTITLAGRYKWFDVLLVKTKRSGHEIENYDFKHGLDIQGKEREKTDPYSIKKDSTLAKFSFSPTEDNRFTIISDISENKSKGYDLSYNLIATTTINLDEKESRHTNDRNKRKNIAFTYENYSSTPFWDSLKLSYSQQKITNRTKTEDYCDGNDQCDVYKNPLGLQIKNGKIADREGNDVTLKKDDNDRYNVIDKNGNPFTTNSGTNNAAFSIRRLSPSEFWLDCSIFDCNESINAYKEENYGETLTKEKITLNKFMEVNHQKLATYDDPNNNNHQIILPNSKGYLPYNYTERNLNTRTKQFNLDLVKVFSPFDVENELSYGIVYSKTKKEMINQAGYNGRNPTWWADRTLGQNFFGNMRTCEDDSSFNGLLCPKNEPATSFLIPVKATTKSLYFADTIRLSNKFSIDLGYRYDNIKYQPGYTPGKTAKIPDDMVKGLFVPLNNIEPYAPSPYSSKYNYERDNPQYLADLAEWQRQKAENDQNPEKNIAYLAQEKKFKKNSYSLGATFDPTDNIKLQLKYSKGFRAPTSDELYFTFKHPDFTIKPNTGLKPEEAKNKEIALTLHNDWGFITTSFFQTNYKQFIDLAYLGSENILNSAGGQAQAMDFQIYRNVNVDKAKVKGIEINSHLNLDAIADSLSSLHLSYKLTYQKGRLDGNRPMNAIQPKTQVFGLGYDHPNKKFGADLYITHVSEKKGKDTYNMFYKEQGLKNQSIKWRSNDYTLIDLVTYAKPIPNLTLQFGLYNLTDRKYLTWESARSIKPFGTSNLINQETGAGINRFYSPGRNVKLSAELTF